MLYILGGAAVLWLLHRQAAAVPAAEASATAIAQATAAQLIPVVSSNGMVSVVVPFDPNTGIQMTRLPDAYQGDKGIPVNNGIPYYGPPPLGHTYYGPPVRESEDGKPMPAQPYVLNN